MDKSLTLLGLARKAGMLAVGDEPVSHAALRRKARLILSASDASDASKRRAESYANRGAATYLMLPYTKSELGDVVGRGLPGMLAVLDTGLAASVVSALAAVSPERYGGTANTMKKRSDRAKQRKKQAARTARHDTGKRRTAE